MSFIVMQVPEEYTGAVVDLLSRRRGEMLNMSPVEGGGESQMTNVEYLVPTRGMIGIRNTMLTATRGTAVMDTIFDSYKPYAGIFTDDFFSDCGLPHILSFLLGTFYVLELKRADPTVGRKDKIPSREILFMPNFFW